LARSITPAPLAAKKQLSTTEITRSLERLDERIAQLSAFNIALVPKGSSPELTSLSVAIADTLERAFGENTAAIKRFSGATNLQFRPMGFSDNYPLQHHYQEGAQKQIAQSIALLREAQRVLKEDLDELGDSPYEEPPSKNASPRSSRKVFVVHGHDEAARETVARFLAAAEFIPIILHEQANQGRTVIEKVEAHGDVGFAVVLLTPDDVGAARGKDAQPRARQNVVLELGYFVGRLGRDRVCALKKGNLEIPSDFGGVVYENMDDGNGWKLALGRELHAAGYDVDWNKVMRP
jgi:predicted nucleotide-binding protein